MSIIIRDFKMPKDCPMCPLAHWNALDEFTGCNVISGKKHAVLSDKEYAESSTRPDWCPLIDISGPAANEEVNLWWDGYKAGRNSAIQDGYYQGPC